MSILFKDRDSLGKPLARVTVDYWVLREDLVTSAIRAIDGRLISPSDSEIVWAAAELTKRWVEGQLKEDLALRGQEWFEYEVGPYLKYPDREAAYRVAAEAAVSKLWPGASKDT
jgi:hypothetical protein